MEMNLLKLKSMPVGFGFRPTDEELINHYLGRKNKGDESEISAIREVDVYTREPWQLPGLSVIESNDNEWFFFCPMDPKYRNKKRLSRSTKAGFWKATGNERTIRTSNKTEVIGKKRTLVFYKGRAPNGVWTQWAIHEYCATYKALDGSDLRQGAFLLWKLFMKHDGKPDENSEPLEPPNCDEIDNPSPAEVEYSAEDTQSEPITNQPEIQPPSVESFQAENYERVIIDPLSPIGLQNNSCTVDDAEHQSLDSISIQMQSDLGCGNHNNDLDGLQLLDDTDGFNINEFFNWDEFDQQLCENPDDFCCAPKAPHPTMTTSLHIQDDGNINKPQIIRASLMNRAHPRARSFSPSRLFKKHDGKPDENSEPPNSDEIDDPSPAVVEYSAEPTRTPILGNQPEIQPSSVEIVQAENYEDPPSPIGLHDNSCIVDDADNQLLDITSIQMQSDLGCHNHNNGLDGLQLPDDTDGFNINEFLNSFEFDQQLCENPDDFSCAPMAPNPTMTTSLHMQDDGNINEPQIIRASLMIRAHPRVQAENYEDLPPPIGLHINSCIVDDVDNQLLDITSIQMQSDLGCDNHNNDLDGLQLQDDTDGFNINEFLNSVEFDPQLCENPDDFWCAPMAPHPTMTTSLHMQDDGNINEPQIIRASLMNRAHPRVRGFSPSRKRLRV